MPKLAGAKATVKLVLPLLLMTAGKLMPPMVNKAASVPAKIIELILSAAVPVF